MHIILILPSEIKYTLYIRSHYDREYQYYLKTVLFDLWKSQGHSDHGWLNPDCQLCPRITFLPTTHWLWNTLPVDACHLPPDNFKVQLNTIQLIITPSLVFRPPHCTILPKALLILPITAWLSWKKPALICSAILLISRQLSTKIKSHKG